MKPSESFVRLTRNPDLPAPRRFEPTEKKPGDIVIVGFGQGGGKISRMVAA